jgi:hypothetical protein
MARRLARDGRITTFDLGPDEMHPAGIVGRSDGRLFVALFDLSAIAFTDLAAAEPTHSVTPTPTGTPIATATPPPGSSQTPTSPPIASQTPTPPLGAATATQTATSQSTAAVSPTATIVGSLSCPGDCNGDGAVSINELLLAVNIALGNVAPATCPAADRNNDGVVMVNELILAVSQALDGCH